jgi:hypothetical protein
MQKSPIRSLVLAAALSAAPVFAQAPQTALQGGFVDGADVMLFANAQQINASAFSKAMKAQQLPEIAEQQKIAQEKFTAATGLGENDLIAMVMSMDIDGINLEEPDPAQMEKIPAVLAVQLAKSVTLEQVAAGIKVMLEEQAGELNITPATIDGLNLLVIKPADAADAEGGPSQAFCGLSADGKTVLMALNSASIQAGVGRIASAKVSPATADMALAMKTMGNKPMRMAVVFPAKVREMIAQGIQEGAAAGGMGAMMMPFATTRSLLVSADVKNTFYLSLQLDLGNPENAQQAANMMQGMIPMMMMGMGQQLGPKAMEISQKLKIAAEGGVAGLSISLTAEDLKPDPNAAPGMMMPMQDME